MVYFNFLSVIAVSLPQKLLYLQAALLNVTLMLPYASEQLRKSWVLSKSWNLSFYLKIHENFTLFLRIIEVEHHSCYNYAWNKLIKD